MEFPEAQALIRATHPRFRSFAEAAGRTLDALEQVVPGLLFLGRLEPEGGCRVLDSRGEAIDRVDKGMLLPLAPRSDGGGDGNGSGTLETDLDLDFLESIGAGSCLALPLEMSDGRFAGMLGALDRRPGAYEADHAAMLGVGARILGYEWELIERRAEARRLRAGLAGEEGTDGETGLPDRDSFLALVEHEWRLAERGTVESVLIAFAVHGAGSGPDRDEARAMLALKTVAETLEDNARVTDRVGRVDREAVAAVLVGCPESQAQAFVARLRGALGRLADDTGLDLEVSEGIVELAGSASAETALEEALRGARPERQQTAAPDASAGGAAQ